MAYMMRREFVKFMVGAGVSAGMRPFRAIPALARESNNDYKALVCVFLYGGNDSNNLVVPLDGSRYSLYAANRQGLSVSQAALLPLAGLPYGLNPNMPGAQSLFNQGVMAIVANMGPLIQPTTKAQYLAQAVPLPDNLESHPDQRNCMTTALQTSGYTSGWGGRIADAMALHSASSVPMTMSLYGATPFINGIRASGYYPGGGWNCYEGHQCDRIYEAEQSFLTLETGATLVQKDQQILAGIGTTNGTFLKAMTQAVTPSVSFPLTSLGEQLQEVAKIMSVRSQLGTRQIFFVAMQGFDTHNNQVSVHGPLLQQLDAAITAFSRALQSMNLFEQVTLFTLSEFTRTLMSNGSGGSDHAWGGHHLVMGGAVKGGQIYGSFPILEFGGPDDISTNGSWLPSTSLNQYAATLASWFGVPVSALAQVLPNIQNFPTPTLGFV